MKTGTIKYNVRERGRRHRGQSRNFDTAALASVINGPEVQERVRKRDLVGYFGHWPRVMFGLNPGEGGIHNGKQITLEPAIVTTLLRADGDGNIEHEAEFLDTAPGRTARRLFQSRAGGFSSAINCRESAGRDVPIGFHGFDYVMEPNYSTNRGWALDGVLRSEPGLMLDAAVSEGEATLRVLDGLYTSLQGDYNRMAEAMARAEAENLELIALLARKPEAQQQAAHHAIARMDAAFERPAPGISRIEDTRLGKLAAVFDSMNLPAREAVTTPEDADQARNLADLTSGFYSRFGA